MRPWIRLCRQLWQGLQLDSDLVTGGRTPRLEPLGTEALPYTVVEEVLGTQGGHRAGLGSSSFAMEVMRVGGSTQGHQRDLPDFPEGVLECIW